MTLKGLCFAQMSFLRWLLPAAANTNLIHFPSASWEMAPPNHCQLNHISLHPRGTRAMHCRALQWPWFSVPSNIYIFLCIQICSYFYCEFQNEVRWMLSFFLDVAKTVPTSQTEQVSLVSRHSAFTQALLEDPYRAAFPCFLLQWCSTELRATRNTC